MNLRNMARALGGEVSNGQVLAPGPGHSKSDRSLSVKLSASSPDGFICFSFAGDDWRECQDYVRGKLGISRDTRQPQRERRQPPQREPETSGRDRARALFAETVDIRGTLGEHYLAVERALPGVIDDTLASTIRFHPSCPFKDGEALVRSPSIICALREPRLAMGSCSRRGDMDAIERAFLQDPANVVAVQRIRLTGDGKKIERRSLGPMANGVVFCSSIWEQFYSGSATIAEGVESALAARKLGFAGCVALSGAGRFKKFEPPHHWGEITISGERGDAASERAWRDAGPRWARVGHHVRVWAPPAGFKDANDLVIARAREARAA